MTRIKTLIAAAATITAFSAARANDAVEWRVLGPAWSKHIGTEYATYKDVGSPTKVPGSDCSLYPGSGIPDMTNALANAGLPTTSCKGRTAPTPTSRIASRQWRCGKATEISSVAGMYGMRATDCYLVEARRKPVWHGMNPAFGLSRTVRSPDNTSDTVFAGFARDSYGSPSLMAGLTHQWNITEVGTLRADAGVTAGLWWRTEIRFDNTAAAWSNGTSDWTYEQHLVRRVVPVVLPMLSVTEATTGLGFNLAYAPRVTIGGREVNTTAAWMLQTTLVVQSTKRSTTTVGVEPQLGGALVNIAKTF